MSSKCYKFGIGFTGMSLMMFAGSALALGLGYDTTWFLIGSGLAAPLGLNCILCNAKPKRASQEYVVLSPPPLSIHTAGSYANSQTTPLVSSSAHSSPPKSPRYSHSRSVFS